MSTFKKSSFCLMAIFYSSILISQSSSVSGNYKGCIRLYGPTYCTVCLKRYLDGNGGCGSLRPESDNCLLYQFNNLAGPNGICLICKKGYALRLTENETKAICVPSLIKNCELAFVIGKELKQVCYACSHGFYASNDSKRCIPPSLVKKPVPHCNWGGQSGPLPHLG